MTLPDAEVALKQQLGEKYVNAEWQPALKAVMEARRATWR
jgi:hypothetical protein